MHAKKIYAKKFHAISVIPLQGPLSGAFHMSLALVALAAHARQGFFVTAKVFGF